VAVVPEAMQEIISRPARLPATVRGMRPRTPHRTTERVAARLAAAAHLAGEARVAEVQKEINAAIPLRAQRWRTEMRWRYANLTAARIAL
jgi:hypothetical protein